MILQLGWAIASVPAEQLGTQVPLDLQLIDSDGRPIVLGDLLDERPTVLVLAWYRCPMLCGVVGQGLTAVREPLHDLSWTALTVSFDPEDRPEDAAVARERDHADWPFLVVADPGQIHRLVDAVGFHARREPTGQWAHPTALFVLGPDGRLADVVPGVRPEPAVLRRALVDAAAGRIARPNRSWIDTCLHWDPASRLHGPAVVAWLRGGATVLVIGLGLLVARLMGRRR